MTDSFKKVYHEGGDQTDNKPNDMQVVLNQSLPTEPEEAKPEEVEKKKEEKDENTLNPRLGAMYMITTVSCQSLNWLSIKYLYIRQPDLNGFQILFFRSVIVTFCAYMYTLFVKKNLYEAVSSPFKNGQKMNLFLRCLQGFIIKSVQFSVFKYFKLTTISLIINLGPIFTLLLSAMCLSEQISCLEMVQVLFAFSGTSVITQGMITDKEAIAKQNQKNVTSSELAKKDPEEYARRDHFTIITFGLLLFVPVGTAVQNILLRRMRKMSSNTVSCYVNPFQGTAALVALLVLGLDATDFISNMFKNDKISLCLFIFSGCSTTVQQILKFKAHQNDNPGKLAVWTYSEVLFQLVYDLALIGSYINGWQCAGMALVFVGYYLKIREILTEKKDDGDDDKAKKQKKDEEK